MPTRPNDAVHPSPAVYADPDAGCVETGNAGMTIREHMATQAMAGILANPGLLDFIQANTISDGDLPVITALFAVRHADALIAALNDKEGDGG